MRVPKVIQEFFETAFVSAFSLFGVASLYLVVRPIPDDAYPTFQLFKIYSVSEVVAYLWVSSATIGSLFAVCHFLRNRFANRVLPSSLFLSVPSIALLGTLFLGRGAFVSGYRWMLLGGLVVGALVGGYLGVWLMQRVPERFQNMLSLFLGISVGIGWWLGEAAMGSVVSLYPFLFVWFAFAWSGVWCHIWFRVRPSLGRLRTSVAILAVSVFASAANFAPNVDSYFLRAQTILLVRMPGVAVNFDLTGPFRLTRAKSSVLFRSNVGGTVEQLVDLTGIAGPQKTPHILIVVVDAFRADRLTERHAPQTYQLANGGVSTTAYSPSPTTMYSVMSMMTGIAPSHLINLAATPITLPQYFQNFGYETGVNAHLEWDPIVFPVGSAGPSFGWSDVTGSRDDSVSLPTAIGRIIASETPRFEYVHLMDTHGPFESAADYDQAIFRADRRIGDAVQRLRDSNVLDNTIIVVAGDHGEALGEHGMWAHSQSLYEEQTRIPLVINRPLKVRPETVSLMDVPKFLSELVDGDFPIMERDARYIVKEFHIVDTLIWRSIRQGDWVFHNRISEGRLELYHLAHDPGELDNVASANPEVIGQFKKLEREYVDTLGRQSYGSP